MYLGQPRFLAKTWLGKILLWDLSSLGKTSLNFSVDFAELYGSGGSGFILSRFDNVFQFNES